MLLTTTSIAPIYTLVRWRLPSPWIGDAVPFRIRWLAENELSVCSNRIEYVSGGRERAALGVNTDNWFGGNNGEKNFLFAQRLKDNLINTTTKLICTNCNYSSSFFFLSFCSFQFVTYTFIYISQLVNTLTNAINDDQVETLSLLISVSLAPFRIFLGTGG